MTPLHFLPLREALERACKSWGMDEKGAYGRLRPHLHAGELRSVIKSADGSTRTVNREWGSDLADDAFMGGYLKWDNGRLDNVEAPAFVHAADLESLLNETASHSLPDQSAAVRTPPKSQGGRPSEYDWDGMYIEAARSVFVDGIPVTELELRKRLLEWFNAQYGREPSLNAIKPKVARLWKALKEGDRQ